MDSHISDTNSNPSSTTNGFIIDKESIHSDSESLTEGKPSPPVAIHRPLPAINQHSPSTDTEGSPSPARPKKRAIDTMLDGEEDNTDCIVVEKHPPPLPSRHTPPPSPSAMKTSSPPYIAPFIDQPMYDKGDTHYDQAHTLLGQYRQTGTSDARDSIQRFFDRWIKELRPDDVLIADALFVLLLETYDPTTDLALMERIPLVMNQILQRKRKETNKELFRVLNLSVQLTITHFSDVVVEIDHTKIKGALDFLKVVNNFAIQTPRTILPRALSNYAFDKPPHATSLIALKFALLGQYCTPVVFERFARLVNDYLALDVNGHLVLSMITLVGEVALTIFQFFKQLKGVRMLRERMRQTHGEAADLDDIYITVEGIMRDIGKSIHGRLIKMIRTETSSSILNVAQLTMTHTFLRCAAYVLGPLDSDDDTDYNDDKFRAMRYSARLAFEGFTTESRRRDILEWSLNWFRRQLDMDYQKTYKNTMDADAVGQRGLTYVGQLFRDRRLLDYLTVDRISPQTVSQGLLFFVYALKLVDALPVNDFETLYNRFITESENLEWSRAWWDGLSIAIPNLDTEPLRTSILGQLELTAPEKLCIHPDCRSLLRVIHVMVETVIQATLADGSAEWDYMAYVKTLRTLLRIPSVLESDDPNFRDGVCGHLAKLFRYHPANGADRTRLAEDILRNATMGPILQRGGDLLVLKSLLWAEAAETVTQWNKNECTRLLCSLTPSLPEVLLGVLTTWKKRQYSLSLENIERPGHVATWMQYLVHVLAFDKLGSGEYQFPREVLEEFWSSALLRLGGTGAGGNELQYWGGDFVTETIRNGFFAFVTREETRTCSGLDSAFVRFFLEQKLPGVSMVSLREPGWSFICKGIENLDSQLGLDYISDPMPLLWKVVRESMQCSAAAIGFMTRRLLKAGVPISVHQEFVESAIDEIVDIGKRNRETFDGKMPPLEYFSFKQSFEALTYFLKEYKGSAYNKREEGSSPASADTMEIDSDTNIVTARCTQTGGPKEFRDIQFPADTPVPEFLDTLASKLSLVRFRVFAQGREISRKESDAPKTISEWGLRGLEAIMIVVQERLKGDIHSLKQSPPDTWVSGRFTELHSLLSGEACVAYATNGFLGSRPPEPRFVNRLRNLDTPWEELFSPTFPWDLQYALYALKECVCSYKKDLPEDQWVVAFGEKHNDKLVLLLEWLASQVHIGKYELTDSLFLVLWILDTFLHHDIETPWVAQLPLKRLIHALVEIMTTSAVDQANLVTPMLNILFTLSTINARLWMNALNNLTLDFYRLSIESRYDAVRENAWHSLRAFFGRTCQTAFLPTNGNSSDSDAENKMEIDGPIGKREVVEFLWDLMMVCLKKSDFLRAGKGFETGPIMLRAYYKAFESVAPNGASSWLKEVGATARMELFRHRVQENVLDQDVDNITLGWTRMLQAVVDLLPVEEVDSVIPLDFSTKVIGSFLFPTLPKIQDVNKLVPNSPYCILSETRGALFDLVFKLARTQSKRSVIAMYLHTLIEEDSHVLPDEYYVDRNQWIQAPSRLSGIQNLSNTCYMNSLMNQLFMNNDFREFIYRVEVTDPEGSQTLLYQLQYLFARLQLGNDKAALPQELAHSIIDFEGHPINIHIQMDVDEFFNLLFDRIESQFKSLQEKSQFRRLYGGVLCHTIKSRECPHVSTREEDFAAIQCDVRGKHTLEDSLSSYVEGEMMDGDNKYSCEACGRHVDAVKQISIKSLPNNLIFHLKRFEYAVDINKRIKVNDYFSFPDAIDLFPYTLSNIETQEKESKKPAKETEQMYDLVGVLVHTGTAESGHYYSYIRDPRPVQVGSKAQWYEFNDSDVKPWRFEELDHWCYGGREQSWDPAYYPEAPTKSYSAYMLFYRKRPKESTLPKQPTLLKKPAIAYPPPKLESAVQLYNDEFARKYVLFGDDLNGFVTKLLRSMPQSDSSPLEHCEINALDDHIEELWPLKLGLEVYAKIIARMDTRSSVEKFCNALKSAVRSSPAARHYFYAWLQKTPGVLRELLLVNINDKARLQSGQLIAAALTSEEVAKPRTLRDNGIDQLDLDAVRNVLADLGGLVYTAGDTWRSWSEYFDTLAIIANDPDWARYLIDENMIANCLYHFLHNQVVRNIPSPPRAFARLKYPDNDRLRPNFKKLVLLLSRLVPYVFVPAQENTYDERDWQGLNKIGMITDEEFELFYLEFPLEATPRRPVTNLFVHRLFETSCDVLDITLLVNWVLSETILRENLAEHKSPILNSLYRQADPLGNNTAEALEVIYGMFEHKLGNDDDTGLWMDLMLWLAKRMMHYSDHLRDGYYGQEYLAFWERLYEYGNERTKHIVLHTIPNLVANLLFYNESSVRQNVAGWIQMVVAKLSEEARTEEDRVVHCMTALFSQLALQTDMFLERKFIVSERSATTVQIATPVLEILRLVSFSFAIAKDNPEHIIERIQERVKVEQNLYDSNYYFPDGSDEDMEDLETDDEESVVESSPYS